MQLKDVERAALYLDEFFWNIFQETVYKSLESILTDYFQRFPLLCEQTDRSGTLSSGFLIIVTKTDWAMIANAWQDLWEDAAEYAGHSWTQNYQAILDD